MYEYRNSWFARIFSITVMPFTYFVLLLEALWVALCAFAEFHQVETAKFRSIYRQVWRKNDV